MINFGNWIDHAGDLPGSHCSYPVGNLDNWIDRPGNLPSSRHGYPAIASLPSRYTTLRACGNFGNWIDWEVYLVGALISPVH